MAETGEYLKPLPARMEENAPFLDGLRQGRLLLQRCRGCGRVRYPPTRSCPGCLQDGAEWSPASGRGRVYSFIVVHQVYHPGFKEDVPYNVAMVELEEGPRLVSNLVGCGNADIRIGMAVEAQFVLATPEVTLLKFRPV